MSSESTDQQAAAVSIADQKATAAIIIAFSELFARNVSLRDDFLRNYATPAESDGYWCELVEARELLGL